MNNLLTIIYAPEESDLLPFFDKATHWLPETFEDTDDIYQLQNTVCTTKSGVLDMLKILISEGDLPFDKVIWINATNHRDRTVYTFSPLGELNNFFKV